MILLRLLKLKELLKKIYYKKILKKRYYRYGSCNMCGACCENIYIRHDGKIIRDEIEFEKIKNHDSYSFYKHVKIVDKDKFGLVFSCKKFDKEKRLCLDHKNRPSICRNYPSEEIFSFGAQLQDNCGFYFSPIEPFDKVFEKICKKPAKDFELVE